MPAAYRLKVTVDDTKPPIWRRIEVWSDTTLAELHEILVAAIGWQGTHLHAFQTMTASYGPSDPQFPSQFEDERDVTIADLFADDVPVFAWQYDFGDQWLHRVELEEIIEDGEREHYPYCVTGKRAAPPEDCGGSDAFARLLKQQSPLLGDPAAFDRHAVNARFAEIEHVPLAPETDSRKKSVGRDYSELVRVMGWTKDYDLTLVSAQAMLAGAATGPEMILPNEWLPSILGDRDATAEALELLLSWHNEIVDDLEAGTLAPLVVRQDGEVDNAAAEQWAQSYLAAINLESAFWREFNDGPKGGLLEPLLILASAKTLRKKQRSTADAMIRRAAEDLGEAVNMLYEELSPIRAAGPTAPTEPIRREPKIGRNEPCPCGSGRKYKVCCGRVA